jgi:hypothetical protein
VEGLASRTWPLHFSVEVPFAYLRRLIAVTPFPHKCVPSLFEPGGPGPRRIPCVFVSPGA